MISYLVNNLFINFVIGVGKPTVSPTDLPTTHSLVKGKGTKKPVVNGKETKKPVVKPNTPITKKKVVTSKPLKINF